MKTCNICGLTDLEKKFKKNRNFCIECFNNRAIKNYHENKTENRKKSLEYYHKNKEKRREYNEKNKEKRKDYKKNRLKNDKKFSICSNVSRLLNYGLKNKNRSKSFEMLNFSKEELLNHLIKSIPEGFTINDYGEKLHLDHIIPVSLYVFESYKDEDFKKCWNLRNLRLIPAKENLTKNNKLKLDLVKEYQIEDLLPENYDKPTS